MKDKNTDLPPVVDWDEIRKSQLPVSKPKKPWSDETKFIFKLFLVFLGLYVLYLESVNVNRLRNDPYSPADMCKNCGVIEWRDSIQTAKSRNRISDIPNSHLIFVKYCDFCGVKGEWKYVSVRYLYKSFNYSKLEVIDAQTGKLIER